MTERERLEKLFAGWGLQQYIPFHTEISMLADYLLKEGVIVPPCKVGDTVYIPHNSCNERGCPFNGDYGNWRCNYKGKDRCKPFIDEKPFDLIMLKNIGKTVFLTKEEAEKVLKEREKQ